jgi:hypothetical protein
MADATENFIINKLNIVNEVMFAILKYCKGIDYSFVEYFIEEIPGCSFFLLISKK